MIELSPEYDAIAASPHTETAWARALRVGLASYGPTPTYDGLRAWYDAHPVTAPTCEARWGFGEHVHACRHRDQHPGRHVCACRSWSPR